MPAEKVNNETRNSTSNADQNPKYKTYVLLTNEK